MPSKKLGPAPTPDLRFVAPPASDAANVVAKPIAYPVELYPEIEPYEKGMLDVGDGHKLYYDVSGNPHGVPALFLHGGPGAGCSPRCRRFFDPTFYRIVILDQRGSGKSSPNAADDLAGSLVENTTPKLVGDIETLRAHLGISNWGLVLGFATFDIPALRWSKVGLFRSGFFANPRLHDDRSWGSVCIGFIELGLDFTELMWFRLQDESDCFATDTIGDSPCHLVGGSQFSAAIAFHDNRHSDSDSLELRRAALSDYVKTATGDQKIPVAVKIVHQQEMETRSITC